MNWAMWSSAAYDFPADLPGYTRGAVVELNRKDWAVRAGAFEVPSAPNSDVLVVNARNFGTVVEFEERHTHRSISPASCGSARSPTTATPAITTRRWRSRRPIPRWTSTP